MIKNNRNHILIDPKFQIKFALIVSGLLLLISLIYPLLFWDFFDALSLVHPQITDQLTKSKNSVLFFFFLNLCLGVGLAFLSMIFLTHKIAGPVYKLRVYFQDLYETKKFHPIQFREGDHFTELAEDISAVATKFKSGEDQREEVLKEIIIDLESLKQQIEPNHLSRVDLIINKLDQLLN